MMMNLKTGYFIMWVVLALVVGWLLMMGYQKMMANKKDKKAKNGDSVDGTEAPALATDLAA